MLRCNHSNETYLAELLRSALYFLDLPSKIRLFCSFFCMLDTIRRVRVKVTLDLVTQPMNSGALFPPVFVYYRVYISLTLRLRLLPMIVKCGDDLRQEQLAYQLLLQFQVRFAVYLF